MDLEKENAKLSGASAETIIEWAFALERRTIVTTKFGPYSAVLLHMATRGKPDIPVVWVDSGYNTEATYLFAERLSKDFHLNMHIYVPQVTAARRNAQMGGVPDVDDARHAEFTRQVKLEPFQYALDDLRPEVWITGIRREQTAHRENLDIVSRSSSGILKVAPMFHWSEIDMETYLFENDLPFEEDYYDPTKVLSDRECGLHLAH